MNVLFLSEQIYPHGSGAELATYLYARLLSENGINVKVITNLFPGEKEITRIGRMEILRLNLFDRPSALKYSMSSKLPILLSSFIRKLIEWSDVVYIPLYWYSAIPIAKAYKKPVLVHLHNYIISCPLGTLYNLTGNSICKERKRFLCPMNCIFAFEKFGGRKYQEIFLSTLLNSVGRNYMAWLASMSDALICVSQAQKRLIMQTCARTFWRKLHVAYNPLPKVSYIEIKGNDFGYFGGNNISKGLLVLYQAMKILNGLRRKDVIVHATKLESFSRDECILSNVGFVLYGKLDELDFENLYKRIRAVVVPSIWQEPLPYVVTEALLRGRIVVASNIGGIPEITKGCGGVELFQAGNHKQLAEKMLYIRDLSRDDIVDLGIRNRQNVLNKFSNDRIAHDFIKIIDRIP
ncbi:MAG: glycosyltransferase family 4 protein [Fervidobacterium sp.]